MSAYQRTLSRFVALLQLLAAAECWAARDQSAPERQEALEELTRLAEVNFWMIERLCRPFA